MVRASERSAPSTSDERIRRSITTLAIAVTVAFMLSFNERNVRTSKSSRVSSPEGTSVIDESLSSQKQFGPHGDEFVNVSRCESILEDAFWAGTRATWSSFASWRSVCGAPGDAVRLCLSPKVSAECPERFSMDLDTISWLSTETSETLVIQPKNAQPKRHRLIAAHGGGFVSCSAARYLGPILFGTADRASLTSYVVEYDLAPASLSALNQLIDVYDQTHLLGERDASFIAVLGDSAGGALAAGLALSRRVSLLILISPMLAARQWATRFYDGYCNFTKPLPLSSASKLVTSQGLAYAWGARFASASSDAQTLRTDPHYSPFEADDSALQQLADHTLIISSENDPLYYEAKAFADRLKSLGASVEFVDFSDLAHDPILRSRAVWESTLIEHMLLSDAIEERAAAVDTAFTVGDDENDKEKRKLKERRH